MIVKQYVKEFEKLGFGMFVHFGVYSIRARGEWYKNWVGQNDEEYDDLYKTFNPDKDWAKALVATAKKAGCKYITLTTRHHDGFSLYDTCGLNDYDAVHGCGRDLVREFVDACNDAGIIPFFYHTLLDWYVESYKTDFKAYLQYLRASVEILCKNYGKIGGFWFDGMWDKRGADWEEDALYGTIRKYQPNAMIINNTGLSARGELGHIELDSVTFERGRPQPINMGEAPKYIASEMCQTLNDHWGYAKNDLGYCSLRSLIEDLCVCRRYGSNFLLNVGPMENGLLRPLDKAMIEAMGSWVDVNEESIYLPRPTGIEVTSKEKDFLLEKDGTYYLFVHDLPMIGSPDVAMLFDYNPLCEFKFDKKIKSVTALDDPSVVVEVEQKDGVVKITNPAFVYGKQMVVRVLKIETE